LSCFQLDGEKCAHFAKNRAWKDFFLDVHLFLRYGAKKDERPEKSPWYDMHLRFDHVIFYSLLRGLQRMFIVFCAIAQKTMNIQKNLSKHDFLRSERIFRHQAESMTKRVSK
jgi:hypothetical protein